MNAKNLIIDSFLLVLLLIVYNQIIVYYVHELGHYAAITITSVLLNQKLDAKMEVHVSLLSPSGSTSSECYKLIEGKPNWIKFNSRAGFIAECILHIGISIVSYILYTFELFNFCNMSALQFLILVSFVHSIYKYYGSSDNEHVKDPASFKYKPKNS